MSTAVTREASDHEIVSELVGTAAWDVVLDILEKRAKALKNRVFSAPTIDETMQARFAHNELKTFVCAVYAKANVPVAPRATSIFE